MSFVGHFLASDFLPECFSSLPVKAKQNELIKLARLLRTHHAAAAGTPLRILHWRICGDRRLFSWRLNLFACRNRCLEKDQIFPNDG